MNHLHKQKEEKERELKKTTLNIPPEFNQFVDQEQDNAKKFKKIRFNIPENKINNEEKNNNGEKKKRFYDIPTHTPKAVASTRFDTKPSSPPFEKTDTWKERVIKSPEVSCLNLSSVLDSRDFLRY